MAATIALVTDVHFGPPARFDGKLRKLSHDAPRLLSEVIDRLRAELRPDALVNLGDDLEDEARDVDLARYLECQAILRRAGCPVLNVVGNHDSVHLGVADLNRAWGRVGNLYYSQDLLGFHLVVLQTTETKDVDVRIDAPQLEWLERDLAETRLPTVVLMHHPASEQDLHDSRWFSRAPHLALVRERGALRSVLEASGKVRLVFNGHVHRNHVDVVRGITYVTLQSLVENLDDDAPGRPAAAFAIARLTEERAIVRVHGADPAAYQIELG
ncbi:MAG: metallophosphoesterase [Polyangiaceae bacterium]|nr:metallophosphoesterase [Polyangiaceae bacterium]